MRKTVEFRGKTADDAVAKALAELGLDLVLLFATILLCFLLGFLAHLVYFVWRGLVAQRLPLASQFEFACGFALCIPLVLLVARTRVNADWIATAGMIATAAIMAYASRQRMEISELMPALRSAWFGIHIGSAVFSYAAFIVAGAPTTAVTSLAATKDVYLVSLDDEHIDALIASSPYYSKNIIPAAAYGTAEDVTTVAVGAVVVAGDDVSDVDVYNFLYGVFENLDNLAHDKANELSLEFASSVTDVPYHPGAVQYFADKGITVPGK